MKEVSVKFLLLISFLFFRETIVAERKDYTEQEYNFMSECVYEIVNNLKKEMGEQFGLVCIGQGGSMPYDIQSIGVDFLLNRQTSVEEARELEIKVTERLVQLVNANEKVRPYLRNYPWDYNRARVMIAFRKDNGENYSEGVRLILQGREQVFYFGPKKFPNDIDHMKEESYIEAKRIVDSSPSCLKTIQKKKKWLGWF